MDIDLIREALQTAMTALQVVDEEGLTEFPATVAGALTEIERALDSLNDD